MTIGIIALIVTGVLALAAVAGILIVRNLTEICQPNEVLVFSGTGPRGYRLVHGGRSLRVPMLEKVDRLDLTNMVIDLQVAGAYSKGGIPLNVQGVANVKIASESPTIQNAIERFLEVPRATIARVAKETLEGNLRGVLATLTPEEVNQDRVKFAESLLHEAEMDLRRLGLDLDMLKIQHVSDDVGYLDSIGRRQSAELQMRSRVAEAENKTLERVRAAENLQTKEIARIDAAMAIAEAEANRRIIDAKTKKIALVAEERSQVQAALAKSKAELGVQRARIEEVKHKLVANQVRPAEAKRDALVAAARGAAATIVEEGRATARSLKTIAETWRQTGGHAHKIVVAQKLKHLVGEMMSTVGEMTLDKVTLIDSELARGSGGDGDAAVKATVASEKLRHTLGVDLPALINGLTAPRGK